MTIDSFRDRTLLPDDQLTTYCVRGQLSEKRQFPYGFLGNWQEGDYSYLFFLERQDEFISTLLAEEPSLELIDRMHLSYRQWQGEVNVPLRIGRFLIQPRESTVDEAPTDCLTITLDAGLVFGDGSHPTTRDCLEALERVFAIGSIDRVLDLGTGSGLLALAAAKLGCREVVAVDLNLLAARTAWHNVRLNGLSGAVMVINARAETVCQTGADLLIANIGYQVLSDILRSEAFLRQKWFVFSGLQTTEAKEIADRLADLGAVVVKQWRSGGLWNTLLGFVPPSGPTPCSAGYRRRERGETPQ